MNVVPCDVCEVSGDCYSFGSYVFSCGVGLKRRGRAARHARWCVCVLGWGLVSLIPTADRRRSFRGGTGLPFRIHIIPVLLFHPRGIKTLHMW